MDPVQNVCIKKILIQLQSHHLPYSNCNLPSTSMLVSQVVERPTSKCMPPHECPHGSQHVSVTDIQNGLSLKSDQHKLLTARSTVSETTSPRCLLSRATHHEPYIMSHISRLKGASRLTCLSGSCRAKGHFAFNNFMPKALAMCRTPLKYLRPATSCLISSLCHGENR